ncbi:hypothetical protein BGZ73_001551 [Actinomortierella ambigua]|nr:hypothetical protein BGZ73_001551 [Actinomortierella ambigua]
MMLFDRTDQPFVTRFDPAVPINATHSKEAEWRNIGFSINYRWDVDSSTLFAVSMPNNQSAVYHAFIKNEKIGFGYLNLAARQMEISSTEWDLSELIVYGPTATYSANKPVDMYPTLGAAIPVAGENNGTAGNTSVVEHGTDIVKISEAYEIEFRPRVDGNDPPPWNPSAIFGEEFFHFSVFINSFVILLMCCICCFRRRYTWNDAQHVKIRKIDSDDGGSGDGQEAKKNNDGDESDIREDTGAEISQKQPENDDEDEPEVVIIPGKLSEECDEENTNGLPETAEEGVERGADGGKVIHAGGRRNAKKMKAKAWERNSFQMSIIAGPVAAPAVTAAAASGSGLGSQSPSVSSFKKKKGRAGNTATRQRIVLSSHPRPKIATMINEGDTTDDDETDNEDDEEEPVEEWVPKPFDPLASLPQSQPQPSIAPPSQPSSTASPPLAEPSAPPLPQPVIPNKEDIGLTTGATLLDPDVDEDDQEPPPMYQPPPVD